MSGVGNPPPSPVPERPEPAAPIDTRGLTAAEAAELARVLVAIRGISGSRQVGTESTEYASTVTPKAPSNDDVLFVGMNPDNVHEVRYLRQANPRANFTPVLNGRQQGHITIQVQDRPLDCDLTSDAGINAFVASMQLPPEQAECVAAVFRNHRRMPEALDELAQIAQVWARAERGGTIPSRLVISGHSNGEAIWGDDNGSLMPSMLKQLAAAMPAAAAQIEDIMLSACNSGGEYNANRFKQIFPNLKTFVGYEGTSPGTWSGAREHLARWEKVTRGRVDDIDPTLAKGLRKGENVATWDAKDGHQSQGRRDTPPSITFPDLGGATSAGGGTRPDPLSILAETQATFDEYFRGDQVVTNTQSGPLRDRYNAIQQALRSPNLTDDQRRILEAARDQTIKLVFYTAAIAPRFAREHGEQLQAGYQALGLEMPNFATLGRKEALQAIAAFKQACEAMENPPEAATAAMHLLQGLQALDDTIPIEWV